MDPQEIIANACEKMEIPVWGIADVRRWEDPLFEPWIPEEFFPHSIYPEARSVLVIGLPVHLPALETSPSIWYRELYKTVNILLDQYTYRLTELLNREGYPSVFVPRDGYGSIEVLRKKPVAFFSHRHAAVLAGLGSFGVNNMVLTKEYGPRIRFGSVLTSARIPSDPLSDDLCIRCSLCVRSCPVHALDSSGYPDGLTEKGRCTDHSAELNRQHRSPCGICIKVCPVGADRDRYDRTGKKLYEDQDRYPAYHRAWDHVRRYGSG